GVVVGAIASDYQDSRVNAVAHEIGLRVFAPLWRRDQGRLLRDYFEAGIEAVFTAVSAEGLGKEWLGRKLDSAAEEELLALSRRFGVSPCGEGGEFETLVTYAPFFERRLEVVRAEPRWEGTAETWRIWHSPIARFAGVPTTPQWWRDAWAAWTIHSSSRFERRGLSRKRQTALNRSTAAFRCHSSSVSLSAFPAMDGHLRKI